MSTLSWILLTSLVGGALSVLCAAALSFRTPPNLVSTFVSYAVGALLGAVFLEILPHALERAASVETLTSTLLAGILGFFLLEKLVLWRHCHVEECEAHDPHDPPDNHDHGRSGTMILIGDTIHNFVDGVLIATAFLADIKLGIVTSLAIIAHEIPQEVGDFLILLHSGYSRRKALAYNLISSLATLLGGALAYFALQGLEQFIAPLLAIAAASMLYVAVADLIPGLHKRPELSVTLQQMTLIGFGIASIWLADRLAHGA
ncbi:MAG: ZIP family metal transporter [Pseudomonadota bacterium]